MYEEYEVVIAQRQLSESVSEGARGNDPVDLQPPDSEFTDDEGKTLDVLTVTNNDITRKVET